MLTKPTAPYQTAAAPCQTAAAPAPWEKPWEKPARSELTVPSPEMRIAQAKVTIAEAEAQIAKDAEIAALRARLGYERKLANATRALLMHVEEVLFCGENPVMHQYLAEFRRELAPLAESYGFKIKVVGNKDVAVLTRA